MMMSTAAIKEGEMSALPKTNGHDFKVVRDQPIPHPSENLDGKLLDQSGNTLKPVSPTLMARLNEKSKDEFTITKGMATIFAILMTAAGLFLGYIVPTVREGGKESEKVVGMERDIQQTRKDMESLNNKFDKLNDKIGEQQRFIDRNGGFQSGMKAAEDNK